VSVHTAPQVHTLHPGDVVCAGRGQTLQTLLGSCVAVILTDRQRTLGAMCHIVHAAQARSALRDSTAHAGPALRRMYTLLQARGIAAPHCQAYVFGGGNMFPAQYGPAHVGADNARAVLQALADAGIELLYNDTGGARYRRLRWTVGSSTPQVTAVAV
jgi:chemotaxis protein CheD